MKTRSESPDPISTEICEICGRDAGSTPFCHLYPDGKRIVLCSTRCAQIYLHPPDLVPNGYDTEGDLIAMPGMPRQFAFQDSPTGFPPPAA